MKVWWASRNTIWHFWSAEWHPFGLWPNSLRVSIRHILFDFFAKRHVPIRILLVIAYFLSIPNSINRDWISNSAMRWASKNTIWHFWSANRHFQSAEWHPFGLWPNSLQVPIRHILFDFFIERRTPIRTLPIVAYFPSILGSINRERISKFSTLFYALRKTLSHMQNSHISSPPPWYFLS